MGPVASAYLTVETMELSGLDFGHRQGSQFFEYLVEQDEEHLLGQCWAKELATFHVVRLHLDLRLVHIYN